MMKFIYLLNMTILSLVCCGVMVSQTNRIIDRLDNLADAVHYNSNYGISMDESEKED